jgi:1,2-diacylglycerol 3-alpha-glucosyltransferase
MRILMVTDTYAPARNGVAVWVAMTVRELRARGHEVEVLTYRHDRRPAGEPGMIEVPAWAGLDPDFKVAPILSGLPEEAERGSWDIVHVHHPILLGPEGVRIGRRAGARVFFTCHSVYTDYLDEYAWGMGRFLKAPLSERIARFVDRCDVALAPSTHVAAWMRECGVGIPIDMFEAPADTRRTPRGPARCSASVRTRQSRSTSAGWPRRSGSRNSWTSSPQVRRGSTDPCWCWLEADGSEAPSRAAPSAWASRTGYES